MSLIVDILNATKTEALKTNIMQRANLSFAQLQVYLEFLTTSGLVEELRLPYEGTPLFRTTQRGIKFLEHYSMLEDLVGPL